MTALQELSLTFNKLTGGTYVCCGIYLDVNRDVRRSVGCMVNDYRIA